MADHVTIMHRGVVAEQGPALEVFETRRHSHTQALFEASTHQPERRGAEKASDNATPLLSVENLVRTYPEAGGAALNPFRARPRFTAVDDVSFAIAPGQCLGLVGESGCGKSTLARAVLGLDAPDDGHIRFEGTDLMALAGDALRAKRRGIQVVFQDPYGSFNPRHRVERLVAEPLHLLPHAVSASERRARVADALSAVGLDAAMMFRYPHEFSGGQRQRIAIARALVTEPRLIVADEAVSALDVSIRAAILDLFARLQDERGLSYLFISHDLTVVRAITDHVMVMQHGRIVESGPTKAVFDTPQTDYARTLLAAAPDLHRAIARRKGKTGA